MVVVFPTRFPPVHGKITRYWGFQKIAKKQAGAAPGTVAEAPALEIMGNILKCCDESRKGKNGIPRTWNH